MAKYEVTEEQQLAEVMNRLGAFIAIGEPGEKLPHLGAARFYVGDEDWHREVLELLSNCKAVALRIGTAPGLAWEIQTVTRTLRRRNEIANPIE